MRKKLYILDVSGFIFRAYFALPPMSSPRGEPTHALFGFIRSMIKLFKEHSPDHIVAVFDGPDNKLQRKEIYDQYKANRTRINEDLPEQIERAKTYCDLVGIARVELPGVEADDAMGTIAHWAEKQGADVYLVTSDKDLCQLVDDHIFVLNPWKEGLVIDRQKVQEIYGVPPERIVDLLAMMGDASDNIPGLTGFGPKTATALLQEFGSLENILNNPEKVPGKKKQETLIQEKDLAILSYKLAKIHTDIPFPEEKSFFALRTTEIASLRAFYLDLGFGSLVKEMDALTTAKEGPEEVTCHLVDDETSLKALIEHLQTAPEIAFDVEATAARPQLAELVGIGFATEEAEGYYVPFNGSLPRQMLIKALRPVFENPHLAFYTHNLKYDIHVLANCGIKIDVLNFDTILASYLLNSESRKPTIDHLALTYFGKVKTDLKTLIGSGKKEIELNEVPLETMAKFCCEKVDYILRLKKVLQKELIKRDLTSLLYDLELPLATILAKMEKHGIYVDTKILGDMSLQVNQDIQALTQEIFAMAGEEFNISSPKQLSHILFDKMGIKSLKKTATGQSTSAEVLEALADEYPIAQKLTLFRTLDKLRSTYVDTLPLEINPKTGRIHTTFNQSVAATGRLSCQDPNLQNIPVRNPIGRKIRSAFKPEKAGWSFLAADYSQIELRLLAHLSEDPNLLSAFQNGEDVHASTASLVFGVPLHEVTKEQREGAKAINFGIIYGQQAFGLSQVLKINVKEAAKFIEAYYERYPAVLFYVKHCIDSARKTGRAMTMVGRQRDIPEITSSNAIVRAAAERLAVNTPLQGSAADLIKLAMIEVDRRLTKENLESYMILQIHDELIFEAKDSELPRLTTLVKEAMEGVFSLKVPLVTDLKVGNNWGEC